jgi:DnaK suppressor protein
MLSNEKVSEYRTKLEAEKKRLLQEISGHEKPTDFGSDVDDFDEEKDEAEQFANNLAISQSLKDRVNEIDGALNRMEIGSYGLCEKCNREIGERMLQVVPETRLCENCKKGA